LRRNQWQMNRWVEVHKYRSWPLTPGVTWAPGFQGQSLRWLYLQNLHPDWDETKAKQFFGQRAINVGHDRLPPTWPWLQIFNVKVSNSRNSWSVGPIKTKLTANDFRTPLTQGCHISPTNGFLAMGHHRFQRSWNTFIDIDPTIILFMVPPWPHECSEVMTILNLDLDILVQGHWSNLIIYNSKTISIILVLSW